MHGRDIDAQLEFKSEILSNVAARCIPFIGCKERRIECVSMQKAAHRTFNAAPSWSIKIYIFFLKVVERNYSESSGIVYIEYIVTKATQTMQWQFYIATHSVTVEACISVSCKRSVSSIDSLNFSFTKDEAFSLCNSCEFHRFCFAWCEINTH